MSASGWTPELPPPATTLVLAPTLAILATGALGFAGWLRTRRGWRANDTRKVFHFLIFSTAAALQLALGTGAVNLLGGVVALAILLALLLGAGHPFYEALARPEDAPRRSQLIAVPFLATALGGIASAALFGSLAAVGFAVTGLADAIAEPIGVRYGRHRYRTPALGGGVRSTRSLEGSGAVLAGSFVAAAAVLRFLPAGADRGWGPLLAVAAGVAAVAAVVEAVSPHGLDNLTLQVAASGVAWGFS
jgi:phytol kinase